MYRRASKKGVVLINSAAQHQMAMEFDHFYPLLKDLTPRSVIIKSFAQLSRVPQRLRFPVFVKGAIKSNREKGWSAVVANDIAELEKLAGPALADSYRSRGKLIGRE